MKYFIFSVIISLISHSNAQLNANELSNLTNLLTDLKAQTSELFSNETFIKEIISTLTKQVDQLPKLLSPVTSANSTLTHQFSDFIKPFLAHFNRQSLNNLINFVQQIKNLGSSGLISVNLIRKFEASGKRVISKLLASKQVIDALKQCMSSAERVFGKIDFETVWKRLQSGYNDQEARKILEKAFTDFSSLIFS